MRFLATAVLLAVFPAIGVAQATITVADTITVTERDRLEQLEKNSSTIRFGLSVGWRHIRSDRASIARDLGIEPMSGKVAIENVDRGAFVLSGAVIAYPWRNTDLVEGKGVVEPCSSAKQTTGKNCRLRRAVALWHWGAIANLNLASFTQDAVATFNKSIEGGLGVAYKLNEEFSMALTMERIFGRIPRSFVKNGEVIKNENGDTLYTLDPSDNKYYRDDHLSAFSIKFVYFLK